MRLSDGGAAHPEVGRPRRTRPVAICITLALTVAAAAGLAASAEARPGRCGQGQAAQHPRRDDRRHGRDRPRADAEGPAAAGGEGNHLRRRDRLVSALLPGAGHVPHRSVRPQPRRRRELLSLWLVRHEAPRQHPAGVAAGRGLPHSAGRQVAERLRGPRRARRGAEGIRHLARAARRLRLRLLQLRDEPRRRAAVLGRRRLRPWPGGVREHRGHRRGQTVAQVFARLEEVFGPRPYTYWGAENPRRLLP